MKKPLVKMPMSQRAKIFAPFAALKGYEEALHAKEEVHVEKILLTEDAIESLNRQLLSLEIGMCVTVTYYHKNAKTHLGEYLQVCGMISKIDLNHHVLTVVDTKISFDAIVDVH